MKKIVATLFDRMNMGRIISVVLFSFCILRFSPAAAQSVSEIAVLAGEKWWGVFAGNSPAQPFGLPFEVNIAESGGRGFHTGYLVSSAGRYIDIGEPAGILFDGKKFTVTSGTKINVGKGGRTLRQAYLVMHHREFTGGGKFPSRELFTNPVYETQADFGFTQTAGDISAYARRLLDEGYPAGIMVLSDGWRDPAGYDFDRQYYPDPKAFIDEMHRMGFKVMLTVRPYIAAYGSQYTRFGKAGFLVTDDDGRVWRMDTPDGVCAVVDMTRSEIASAVKSGMQEIADRYGIDGFRMDCLDFIGRYDGGAVDRTAFLKAWRETGADFALCEFMPGFEEYQADHISYVGCPDLTRREYIGDMITAGLAGGPFTFAEPVGVNQSSDRDIVRDALTKVLMPVARVPFAPWQYGFAAEEIKRVLTFRASISEYMGEAFSDGCKTLEPIIRPMEYMFANQGFADCSDQYMLGDKYLIAPVVDNSQGRLVRLPKGLWRDMDGRKHKGPVVLEVDTGGYRAVWFERN